MHCVQCKHSDFGGDTTRTGAVCLNPQSEKYGFSIVTTDSCQCFELFKLAVRRD